MVFDSLVNAQQYYSMNPHFEAAFKWLEENQGIEAGRYEIVGEDCYVMIQHTQGNGKSTPFVEAHNEYIDIQVVTEGFDEIGWKDRATCSDVRAEYSADVDAALWHDESDFFVPVQPGHFVILFPHDAHMPLASEGPVKKAVVKVRVSN